jgi:molybdopterin molybdotransferase
VSVGEHDFVKSSFEAIGGEIAFWRVAIRPGKPFVFGKLGDKYLFGLPGNPVSSFVTFLLLVRPALLKMQSATDVQMRIVQGTLAQEIVNANDRAHYVRVKLNSTGEVRSTGKQASHVLTSLSQANALLEVPPQHSFKTGEVVKVLLWS